MPPNHLALYLSNRCNLSCSYCYVSVNEGPPERLRLEDLRAAIDAFLADDPTDKKITFLGGEPMLDFPVLEQAAAHARERGGPGVVLQTFTNGTLLDARRLKRLEELDVWTTVSLDGPASVNDKHRKFVNGPERSVYENVAERLKKLDKSRLGVSLVFTSESVDRLLSNIDFFYKQGFGRITFNPELYELWPEAKLRVLERTMDGLRRYYKAVLDSGARPFVIQILYAILDNEGHRAGRAWWHECHNVVLGPDKKYYSCDKSLTFPIGEAVEQAAGDLEHGPDWASRAAMLKEASAFVDERAGKREEDFCPMGVYFYAKHAGLEPGALVDNFHRVADAFGGGLKRLVSDLREHPKFQDLYVDTRRV